MYCIYMIFLFLLLLEQNWLMEKVSRLIDLLLHSPLIFNSFLIHSKISPPRGRSKK
ncbi:unnamed protein product [Meloidogyne enterolobii]|uniref:Uncharacterized protein n=1 Tax=Meloidogyne enterolobii TaxID=390850 RepID=A0ACB0YLY5_MELEN